MEQGPCYEATSNSLFQGGYFKGSLKIVAIQQYNKLILKHKIYKIDVTPCNANTVAQLNFHIIIEITSIKLYMFVDVQIKWGIQAV